MPNSSTGRAEPPLNRADLNPCCDSKTSLLLFLAGMGTGVVLSLLFAPASGTSLRSGISRRFKTGTDWLQSKAAEAKEEVVTQATALREGVEGAARTIKQR